MKCPRCGHENAPDAPLCAKCRGVRFVRATTGRQFREKLKDSVAATDTGADAEPKAPGPARPASPPPGPPRPAGTAAKPPAPKLPPRPAPAPRAPAPRSPEAEPLPARTPAGPRHALERVGAPPLELDPGHVFSIGRQATCSLPIPSGRVSRVHAEIIWEDGKPFIVDKDSANGTFVRGSRVKSCPLVDGDEIEIGPFLCVYRLTDPAAAALAPGSAPNLDSQTISEGSELLAGTIGEGGLAEVLQSLSLSSRSGTLQCYSRLGDGWLALDGGVPTAAEALDGAKKDEEAALFLLSLEQGWFSLVPEVKTRERRIRATVMALLLEWGRRADEAKRLADEGAAGG